MLTDYRFGTRKDHCLVDSAIVANAYLQIVFNSS